MREGYRRQQPGAPFRYMFGIDARRVCFAAGIFRGVWTPVG